MDGSGGSGATVRIEAERLVPGRGEPILDAVVVLDGPVIGYAGPADGAPETPGVPVHRAETVLPGLWDCHVHLLGMTDTDPSEVTRVPVSVRAARCVPDLAAALRAGFTSVREAGGFGAQLARAVEEGSVPGPRVYGAGAWLSVTGGHGDLSDLPLGWVHDLQGWEPSTRLCDGVDGCVAAVREQLRDGAEVIKVLASGGVMSERNEPRHQQFTSAELRAIVEVAAMSDRSVMAHCHSKPGMLAAIEAGVRTIEHGTYLDEEVCAALVENDVLLVPTLLVAAELLATPESHGALPATMLAKMRQVAETHAEAVALAHGAGVRMALGTDVMVSGAGRPLSWGTHGREFPLLVGIGMTPLEAIEAATANGPDTLGARAPRSGQLVAGHDADVLAVRGDPVADISVLAHPRNVTAVWRAGEQVVPTAGDRTEPPGDAR